MTAAQPLFRTDDSSNTHVHATPNVRVGGGGGEVAHIHANMQVEAKAGNSWNINRHRCINIDTHSDFHRDSWKTQPRSIALFREHTAFVWATMI